MRDLLDLLEMTQFCLTSYPSGAHGEAPFATEEGTHVGVT